MGTNRRYADSVDRAMDKRVLDSVARAGPLATLTRMELELDMRPVTIDPRPSTVRAWVRFGGTPIEVEAEACRWTEQAVAIRFTADGREFRCWVWRGAVREKS